MTEMIRLEGVSKLFGAFRANDGISLQIAQGEIHALLGENGAGKTTLMNMLYGLLRPDEGQIYVREKPVVIDSPKTATELGIGMIHQHFMLVPVFTVTENVILGLSTDGRLKKALRNAEREIERLANEYGLDVDPRSDIERISLGMQQRVEIIKALYRGAEILIMDEPTAVLTTQEVRGLLDIMKRLATEGHTIIFISHKLDEVMEVADRLTVLRRGKVVASVNVSDIKDKSELATMMVGRDLCPPTVENREHTGEVVLEVEDLRAMSDRGTEGLRGVSFRVHSGEILGIAGVDGNGQRELAETIAGLRKTVGGHIRVNGKETTKLSRRELQHAGVALLPEDRRRSGLVLEFTVLENLILDDYREKQFSRAGFINNRATREYSARAIEEFSIATPGPDVQARQLSGGNQQKIILARNLAQSPRVLIAAQPTRGLDVGATEYVESRLLEQRERGAAILLISTELEEIMSLSDRIAVMYRGEIVGTVSREEATAEGLGVMMAGCQPDAATTCPVP
jgi:ABC-type uncharacterized transport system ATPase subunit